MSQDEKNTLKNESYLHGKGLGEYINSNNKYYKIIDQQLKLKDEFNYATDIRKKPMGAFQDFLSKNGYNDAIVNNKKFINGFIPTPKEEFWYDKKIEISHTSAKLN